ncbi:MAG: flagellar basal body P-ring protein FlgI [Desulfobacterales bacterium]|nr:flagellar basal body P-ring protein FlgI [Desulfobacterales bacterium]
MLKKSMLIVIISFILVQNVYAVRIKDIASIKGVRTNQLIGYGLVVGLDGTGDKTGADFTIQSIVNMMEEMGVHVSKSQVKVKNVAAVMVTANMPPFSKIGNKIDVTVSSVGDAKSLAGGTLLLTPLRGVDGKAYALAQGPLAVGGFGAAGAGAAVTQNYLVVGRVPRGASIEREIPFNLSEKEGLTMTLYNPDFTTALRIADVINVALGEGTASALDSGTVNLKVPSKFGAQVAKFIGDVETLEVMPDTVAKVIINEKTGTVVIGENVRISTVAVSHGNLSITVQENPQVSQPQPLGQGQTTVTPQTQISVKEQQNKLVVVNAGSTIGELVRALNAIGVSPRDLVSIFQSIKASGALQAELEII